MIKRNGVEIMNARTKNVALAKETIAITKQKHYTTPNGQLLDISNQIDDAVNGTILYENYMDHKDYEKIVPHIEVVNETTAQAAVRLINLGKTDIVALNFASARNQGGGFLAGAVAQEEDLCRCSGLYACLKRKPMFYNANILCNDAYYTHNVLYSPKVPFFRNEFNLLLEEPYLLSIISAPAPNLSGVRLEGLTTCLQAILRERAVKILQIAEEHGHKNIILGAWGCGAFRNDPNMVANTFMFALQKVPTFEHVCFAVYDTKEPPVLYETFKGIFLNERL